jgi:hypothetical protein
MAEPSSLHETMFRMITGFWVSQAIGTMAELRLADRLGAGATTADELARQVGADERAMFRLLRACACLGVVTHDDGDRFSLTPLGATLRSDLPGSMGGLAIAQTAPGHWLPWGRLREAVLTGKRQTPAALGCEIFEYYGRNLEEGGAFMSAMHGLAMLVASELVRLVDWSGVSTVVDVGGAHGALVSAVLRASPSCRGILLDLPHVIAEASERLAAAGVAGRCEALAGDFFEQVPAGDVYVLKQILHDWDDDQALVILRNCAEAMEPNGRVLIVETVIPDDRRPTPAQLMDLNMLVMLPGRERTAREYGDLIEKAGLRLRQLVQSASPFQIIEAGR